MYDLMNSRRRFVALDDERACNNTRFCGLKYEEQVAVGDPES